jgi:hypothetical protein
VVVVVEENHTYSEIIGNPAAPYINSLTNDGHGALFTQSYGVTHPSQPNYLDLFAGSNQGLTTDTLPTHTPFSTPNLGAELLARGRSFTGYAEGLSPTATSGVRTPWVDWVGTGINRIPRADSKAFTSFPTAYSALPTMSFVIPSLADDMHDGSIAAGDTWLKDHLGGYVQWAITHNSLLILTFDEGDHVTVPNHIPTIFVGPMVQPGRYSETITHFNVLRTIEAMYGLPFAGASATAAPISNCWTTRTVAAATAAAVPQTLGPALRVVSREATPQTGPGVGDEPAAAKAGGWIPSLMVSLADTAVSMPSAGNAFHEGLAQATETQSIQWADPVFSDPRPGQASGVVWTKKGPTVGRRGTRMLFDRLDDALAAGEPEANRPEVPLAALDGGRSEREVNRSP